MSDQQKPTQPPPKKPDLTPGPPTLPRVKVCWAEGSGLAEGRYDADRGIIHTTRAKRPVMVSVHSGIVKWWAPV